MVLLRRLKDSASQTGQCAFPSSRVPNKDIVQYFIVYESVTARSQKVSEKLYELLNFHCVEAFDFFYQFFHLDGNLSDSSANYKKKIKKVFMKKYYTSNRPEKFIFVAVNDCFDKKKNSFNQISLWHAFCLWKSKRWQCYSLRTTAGEQYKKIQNYLGLNFTVEFCRIVN